MCVVQLFWLSGLELFVRFVYRARAMDKKGAACTVSRTIKNRKGPRARSSRDGRRRFLAPLVVVTLTGKVIQGYHFYNRLAHTITLGLLLTFALMLMTVKLRAWLVATAVIAVAAIGFRPIYRDTLAAASETTQQRVWEDGFIAVPNYRKDIAALLQELDRDVYSQARILGTFDQQLAVLWVIRPNHTLFIPDTFLSQVRDAVIQRRTIALSRLVGMSEEEFMRKANQHYFQVQISITFQMASQSQLRCGTLGRLHGGAAAERAASKYYRQLAYGTASKCARSAAESLQGASARGNRTRFSDFDR